MQQRNKAIVLWLALCLVFLLPSCHAPKPLVYQDMEHFRLDQAGLSKSTLFMDVRLYNPNNYRMKLKRADVDVFLNGTPMGKMLVKERSIIDAHDTCTIPVKLDVDMKNILSNMLQLAMNSEVTVKLSGNISAGRHGLYIRIPVDYESKQDIQGALKW